MAREIFMNNAKSVPPGFVICIYEHGAQAGKKNLRSRAKNEFSQYEIVGKDHIARPEFLSSFTLYSDEREAAKASTKFKPRTKTERVEIIKASDLLGVSHHFDHEAAVRKTIRPKEDCVSLSGLLAEATGKLKWADEHEEKQIKAVKNFTAEKRKVFKKQLGVVKKLLKDQR